MGLLSVGKPLVWEESKQYNDYIREHGITQLINIFGRLKSRHQDILLWGDEIECMIVKFDDEHKRTTLSLRGKTILEKLHDVSEQECKEEQESCGTVLWHPEYGRYMIESTPGEPYGGSIKDFLKVERNMLLRRKQSEKVLEPNEKMMVLTTYPRLGCPHFTNPDIKTTPVDGVSRSIFFPDDAINEHPRFATLTANIRKRRGRKVAIHVPIFKDENTPSPFVEKFPDRLNGDDEHADAAKPDHIYMDAMGFGMGNCSVQVTFQARNVDEARDLYDQLAVVCPVMLALSASSPIFRGYLADVDARWDVIAASVDCRTPEELGEKPDTEGYRRIPKSRYGPVSAFIANNELCKDEYNDTNLVIDEDIKKRLMEAGFDDKLASHFAHLFIRDPLVIFEDRIELDDATCTEHFENLQSTNWQTMRFKPPPPNSDIGWRVEFRPCEVQITDFENSALVIFVVLLSRTLLSFHLNFYMPISKVDENMTRSQKRDAILNQKFWFRETVSNDDLDEDVDADAVREMSADEIFNGKDGGFVGLIPLIKVYLRTMRLELQTRCEIERYLNFISKRARGEIKTAARWMRDFVQQHKDYKKDSVVTETINYDLLKKIDEIATSNDASCFKVK